jgi:hypothetical protein
LVDGKEVVAHYDRRALPLEGAQNSQAMSVAVHIDNLGIGTI